LKINDHLTTATKMHGVTMKSFYLGSVTTTIESSIQDGPKSKPLPSDQKIVLNRIKACH